MNYTGTLLGNERMTERQLIGRYSMYNFWYRWSLEDHIEHLRLMARVTLPLISQYLLNEQLVLSYIDVHDDPEIYPPLGDVQAAYKAVMDSDERAELEKLEAEATDYAIERFGKLNYGDYSYEAVLRNYQRRLCPEAQLVHFLDKISAFCEASHELFAGNADVTVNTPDSKGRTTSNPFVGYPRQTEKLISDQPFLKELRWHGDVGPFLYGAPATNYLTILKGRQGKMHTSESVQEATASNGVYGAWVRTILESGNSELIKHLYTPNTFQFPNCRPASSS